MTSYFSSTRNNCWFNLESTASSKEHYDYGSSEEEGETRLCGLEKVKKAEGAKEFGDQAQQPPVLRGVSGNGNASESMEGVGGKNAQVTRPSVGSTSSRAGKKSSGAQSRASQVQEEWQAEGAESHPRLLRSASTSQRRDLSFKADNLRRRSAHHVVTTRIGKKKSVKTESLSDPESISVITDLLQSDSDQDQEDPFFQDPSAKLKDSDGRLAKHKKITMKSSNKTKGDNCSLCGKVCGKKSGKTGKKHADLNEAANSVIISLCEACSLTFSSNRRNNKADKSFLLGAEENSGIEIPSKGSEARKSEEAVEEKRVFSYQDAPSYLKFNPYITGGYRTMLTPRQCVKSLFWWTNETLNIWSHLLGWLFFLALSIYDAVGLLNQPTTHPWDRVVMAVLLVSFQACMLLSALYHVFCCCSERFYRRWLSADLFGVSLSLLAIYISGIYYAFSCVPFWLNFYLITVGAIFVSAMVMQIIPVVHKPTTAKAFHGRLVVFGGWAAYGVVPTLHWALLHGGMSSPVVALLLPRIFGMYVISFTAFFFYVLRVPEKIFPGLVNFIGSSHQIWHILIVAALYHWHNTGLLYLQFRATNSCAAEYEFLFPSVKEEQVVQVN